MPEPIEEGWGITNDGENIIISDGTDNLYYAKLNQNMTAIDITSKINVNNKKISKLLFKAFYQKAILS